MKRNFAVLRVVASLLALGGAASAAQAAPEVTTEAGRVAGKSANKVDSFLGVPYGGDTGGRNRWRAPQPAATWTGVRDATQFGADCQQDPPHSPPGGSPWSPEYFPTQRMSEDCLFVNVWTPSGPRDAKRPVMVWIHGGGFGGGSGSVPLYDGEKLASQGIVVVSLNYRVSVYGFLAHPALTAEAGSSGNYGLMDQVAALRWIQKNIASFGGDPKQVTIAGQSAGAASVHALMSSPSAEGLFIRAIAQSGSGMGMPGLTLAEAEARGEKVVAAASVAGIDALRKLPVDQLAKAARDPSVAPPGIRYFPIVEKAVLPDPARQRQDIPVLTGLTTDESSAGPDWKLTTSAKLDELVTKRFAASATTFRPYYQGDDGPAASGAAQALLREQAIASMMNWADARKDGAAPVYAYLFQHPQPGTDAARFGTFHSAELPYVFATLDKSTRPFTKADHDIAATFGGYWVNFVKTGNPNGTGLAPWPAVTRGKIMSLGDKVGLMEPMAADKLKSYKDFVANGGKLGLF
ncbi:carboxylesterase/lipase family protein [Niveispirillum sp. KHB5.9]|uniref:carboxylesterase/lipase family protein n=1 Tax=Niveispirillum sp. KHB5.9 TaxID=3400269 RepID=UPI003A8A833B